MKRWAGLFPAMVLLAGVSSDVPATHERAPRAVYAEAASDPAKAETEETARLRQEGLAAIGRTVVAAYNRNPEAFQSRNGDFVNSAWLIYEDVERYGLARHDRLLRVHVDVLPNGQPDQNGVMSIYLRDRVIIAGQTEPQERTAAWLTPDSASLRSMDGILSDDGPPAPERTAGIVFSVTNAVGGMLSRQEVHGPQPLEVVSI
jgi:hypothetical protein